jgi:hypothetical protein
MTRTFLSELVEFLKDLQARGWDNPEFSLTRNPKTGEICLVLSFSSGEKLHRRRTVFTEEEIQDCVAAGNGDLMSMALVQGFALDVDKLLPRMP